MNVADRGKNADVTKIFKCRGITGGQQKKTGKFSAGKGESKGEFLQ